MLGGNEKVERIGSGQIFIIGTEMLLKPQFHAEKNLYPFAIEPLQAADFLENLAGIGLKKPGFRNKIPVQVLGDSDSGELLPLGLFNHFLEWSV
jgi:hypothetical protein